MTIQSASHQPPCVAIIGAGQLGYLLCEAARDLGIATLVVTPDPDAPAIAIADAAIVAPLDSPQLAERIAKRCSVVTFEFEAVADTLLNDLDDLRQQGLVSVHPDPAILRMVKNKARQKAWLTENGFPTAAYRELDAEAASDPDTLASLALPFVQKVQEGGYDGYGVQIIDSVEDLQNFWPVPSIVETYLANARELAVVTARSIAGETLAYPAVELVVDHARNILDVGIAPAQLPEGLHEEANTLACKVIDRLGGVGVFAVEMFLLADGQLLINEISPRVHNSGHHTLEACTTSQFEQHIRAVSGLPLAPAEQSVPAIMQNILYDESLARLLGTGPGRLPVANAAVCVHWYGKKEARPGRKMGHITWLGSNPADGRQQIDDALAGLSLSQGD